MTDGAQAPVSPVSSSGLAPDDLEAIFDCAPTSLWLQDLSLLKQRLDRLRQKGVMDLGAYLDGNRTRVEELVGLVRIVAVNAETLRMYEVADEAQLFAHVRALFGDDHLSSFVDVIVQLWDGASRTRVVTRNYSFTGRAFDLSYNGRLLPGHEASWARYLISVEDVSTRESALRQLEAARVHDPLTGLYNRLFLVEEMERLQRSDEPVAFAVIDINGLKTANDRFGHEAGDDLLRHLGELLAGALPAPCRCIRMGGDEFVVILPGAQSAKAREALDALSLRVEAENKRRTTSPLTFSLGLAWRLPGESLDTLLARADRDMYESKRAFYGRAA